MQLCPAPVRSLEWDLIECGVPAAEAGAVGGCYAAALESGACIEWIAAYAGVFATLAQGMHRTRAADTAAARRLLLLINDDLGVSLFDCEARTELMRALVGCAA
ncbi:MAG TPA: hypothetical protein VFE17_02320 [Candidatus Baltobacteraceae bacterium]|jgi:hypothetical protein|nr:hypothetical protein [Candidatus Baltobacteraceae bacterium]